MQLLPVPNFQHELKIKADLNGITILTEGTYRKRYTGSKRYAVDINGNLSGAAELQKSIALDGKKIERRNTPNRRPAVFKLDPDKVKKKSYTINKPEIRQRIFAMIAAQRGKKQLYFWTVTFPMLTGDAVIYKLFNIWLTTLRQKTWLKNYLWVAERQINGTLHFHLCIPHKLSVVAANRAMASILAGASRRGEIDHNVYACKRYNGVDISKNRKTRKVTNFAEGKRGRRALIGYISKYITKNDGEFSHLAWHNSRGFSQLFTGVTFTFEEFQNVYALVPFVRRQSAIRNEYFMYFPWLSDPPPQLVGELVKLNWYVNDLSSKN